MPESSPNDLSARASRPTQIRAQTWSYVSRRTIQEFIQDGCVDAAAGLTFFAVLSVFPAGLAIVALVGVLGDSETVLDRLFALLSQVAPASVTDTLRGPLNDIAGSSTADTALIIGVATSVWSASIYVGAFGRAMNRIYGVREGRPYWMRKPAQLAVTVALMILALVVIAVVVFSGPVSRAIGDVFSIGDTALAAWDIVKWPLLAASVVAMVTVLYKGTSNLDQPRFRWLSLGAILAITALGLASFGLAIYVANFDSYNRTFGTLAGVVVFLIWLFIINLALLFGAEFNAELERGRQLQAGIQAETDLQLPPRDTTTSDKVIRSVQITQERGEMLRKGEDLPPRSDTVIKRTLRFVRRTWERLTHRG